MNYIILQKGDGSDYSPIENRVRNINMLWLLLNDPPPYIKEWVLEPSRKTLSTNNCYLRKEGNKVIISFLYSDLDPEDDPDVVSIIDQQLCDLVDQWDRLYEAGAQKIILWQHGDDFYVSEYIVNPA